MKRSKSNFAIDKPQLLSWFASKNPLAVFFKIVPILAYLLYFIFAKTEFAAINCLYFALGLLFWSFAEYCIHRWIYHVTYKNESIRWFLDGFHIHHHKNLQDYRVLNAGFLMIYPIFILISVVVTLSTSWVFGLYFTLGVLLYYFFYENVHYFIHYKKYSSGYMQWIQKYHLYHHYRQWNKNYGNTVTLWDRIFGTYDARFLSFELTERQVEDLMH